METVSTHDFLTAIEGKTSNPSGLPASIRHISLDSRTITVGDAYWALRGKNHDGHEFVESAIGQGAAACIVEESYPHQKNHTHCIHVKNTLAALQDFARWYRSRYSITSIGITGSYGKTTTKELLHAVLSTKHPGVRSEFNYNNEIGVPLTVLNLDSHHQYLVAEMGAAKPDDIRPLTEIAQPQVGIITGIGPAHLLGFESLEQIAHTKGDLVAALPKDGFAVVPGATIWTETFRQRSRCNVITVGLGAENTFSAGQIESDNYTLSFQTDGHNYRLPIGGRHHLATGLAVIAVAKELGHSSDDIQRGFERFQPLHGRGRIAQESPWTVIDDTYNANPTSCRAACEMLGAWQIPGKRILVLGDMLDLGEKSAFYHEELGEIAAKSGIEILLTLGQQGDSIQKGVRKVGDSIMEVASFTCHQDLIVNLHHRLRDNDVVLIKGSRGMRMERVLQSILNNESIQTGVA